MDIVLHAGVHCTDEERLVKCLLRNKDRMLPHGIAVPGPSRYRRILREAMFAQETAPPAPEARDVLLDTIVEEDGASRLLMSNQHFFAVPNFAVMQGRLYPQAAVRVGQLKALFPQDRLTVAFALCNPATFLPALYKIGGAGEFLDFLKGSDPRLLRWSEMVQRIRDAHPDVELLLWCNEDTPMIWAQIVREVAGLDHTAKISGGFDILHEIMSKEGMHRFRTYLASHPVMTERQKRRVIAAFLDKFAVEDQIEEELDLPGWDEAYIDELTETYEEDVFLIERIPGVQVITP